jgi:hypothetical protein
VLINAIASRFRGAAHVFTVLTARPPRGITASGIVGVTVMRFPVRRDRHGYVYGYPLYLSSDIPLAIRLLANRRSDVYLVEPPPTSGQTTRRW